MALESGPSPRANKETPKPVTETETGQSITRRQMGILITGVSVILTAKIKG